MQTRRFRIWGLISALLVSPCFLKTAHAQATGVGFVQAVGNTTFGSASSSSLSFPANTVAGDLILVGFDFEVNATASVSDSQGNSFTQVGNQLTSPGGARSQVYYAKSIKGGADTVTVKLSANSSLIEIYLTEYRGVDPTNPIDAQAGASGSAGPVSSGNTTTTVAGDLIYGFCIGDWVCTAGSGFATRSKFDGNLIEDEQASNAGTHAATGSANNGWTMQMVALKPAPSVAGGRPAPPVITSATTAGGTVGSAFSYQISATGSPTSYGATGLPAGLSVNSTTGLISGTPTAAGTSTLRLSAANGGGTTNANLTLWIFTAGVPAAPPLITSPTTVTGTVAKAFSYRITATNSPTSYGATGLPAGLSVSSTTGLISGTPTTARTSTVTLTASNSGGTCTANLTLRVAPAALVISTSSLPDGKTGTAYTATLAASGGSTPYSWSLISGTLPTGLSLNASSGAITGTATQSVTNTSLTFQVTDSSKPALTQTASLTLTVTVASTPGSSTIALSPNGKYLVNPSTGQPVFLVGDAPQMMPENLDTADVTTYLSDRASRGFNALWIYATDKSSQPNPPYNFYGYQPYDGADFTNEDANYWAYVDSIVNQAGSLGMTVFLMPFFVGSSSEQPYEYYSSFLAASPTTLQEFGTFLGNRYASFPNIVWVLGGDSKPSDAGVYSQLNIVGAAIAAADPNHLITLEACEQCTANGYSSVQAFQAVPLAVPSWLKLNWVYPTSSDPVAACNAGYNQSPFLPPLMGEDFYELENNTTPAILRFEGYSEILSGCYLGRIFGNGALWSFNSPHGSTCVNGNNECKNPTTYPSLAWKNQLASPGTQYQTILGKLFRSREHWLMVPDTSHAVVTAGYGSGLSVTTTARSSDGQTIIAYIPNGNATTITVDMTKITSATTTVRGWWFDPRTGATTNLGIFSNSGTQDFTPPDSNDWVLILDDANANLPAPGTSTASS